jgi:hypothetical protein
MIRLVPLLAVEPSGLEFFLFCVVTAGLIAGSLLVAWLRLRDYALVILGLLVAASAVGYGLLGDGAAATHAGNNLSISLHTAELAGTLMKIAVVLVLAGVARSLLLACSGQSASDTPKP